jgi:hypothetical protein
MEVIVTVHTEDGTQSVSKTVEKKEDLETLLKGKGLADLGKRVAKAL